MSAIAIRNVWKEFAGRIVLERVSFDVAPGAFVALVGPSGCGKTTFLRMLLSEERPSRGRILIEGQPVALEPTADRGVVFQRYSVFAHLSVLGNVMLGREFEGAPVTARLFGRARRAAEAEARALLDAVGLADAADRYPAQLSGGMQQRLALAQALIRRPRILLLDEPFGALDPGIRADIHQLMRRLWRETGMTVVMVTHDLSEAFNLATRVIVFDREARAVAEPERFGATITGDIPLPRNAPPPSDPPRPERAASTRQDAHGRDSPALFQVSP